MSAQLLLDTDNAAEYLKLSRTTLERMRVLGTGPRFVKLGPGLRAKVVYRQSDIDAWLEKQLYDSTAEYNFAP